MSVSRLWRAVAATSPFASPPLYLIFLAVGILSIICGFACFVFWKSISVGPARDFALNSSNFIYVNFLKPHAKSDSLGQHGQQTALEGFYKAQGRPFAPLLPSYSNFSSFSLGQHL